LRGSSSIALTASKSSASQGELDHSEIPKITVNTLFADPAKNPERIRRG
jgi:hypothetical protein